MSSPIRVLLVDDSDARARRLLHALTRAGLTVDSTRVADAAALGEALARPWDVAMTGGSAGAPGAREVLRMVGGAQPDLPVIVVANVADDEEAAELMRAGARDVVPEASPARLAPAVEREVGVRRSSSMGARLRRLADSGTLGIAVADIGGTIREVNDAYRRLLGFAPTEPLPPWPDLVAPGSRAASEDLLDELRATGVAGPMEIESIRKDGRSISLLVGVAMLDATDCIAFLLDLTARRLAEAALRARARIGALIADVSMALTRADAPREILQRCAQAIARQLDADLVRFWTHDAGAAAFERLASAGSRASLQLVAPLDADAIAQSREPRIANDLQRDPDARVAEWARGEGLAAFAGHPLVVDGDLVGVMALAAREPFDDTVLGGLATIADAAALGIHRMRVEIANRSLEEQLRHAQKMEAIGSLAGGIAHDFNNILSVILSNVHFLIAGLAPRDPMRADLEEVAAAGERAVELTRHLLAFGRRQVLRPHVTDLNTVVLSLEPMLRRLIGEDVELAVIPLPVPATAHVDPVQVEQVLLSLVMHGRAAMPKGGRMTIEVDRVDLDDVYAAANPGVAPGSYVMLAVDDSGAGVDDMARARIFEPFFTTHELGRGTGLGLAMAFGIVRQSGGSIQVESESGVGTTFRVYLPSVDIGRPAQDPGRAGELPALRGSETVLLVEDDPGVRRTVAAILRRHGYTVLEASGGGDALLMCEQHREPIDLLLTDVVMPHMSGGRLAARLRALRPKIRVLYMSGYPDHGLLDPDIELVQKPVTPLSLMTKVRAVLDARPRHQVSA